MNKKPYTQNETKQNQISMKLEIKKKLLSRSERVKSVDVHPSLPWVLIALYAGTVMIYDYNSQT